MQKSLDRKLAAIHADPHGCKEFLIADAKDADMGFGVPAPGVSPERHPGEVRYKTLADYREQIRQIVRQGVVDIMLMSNSTSDQLTLHERIFDNSAITPAIRANDTTDIFVFRGSQIPQSASRPFRSAHLDHAQCGHLDCAPEDRVRGCDLGLYSVTFNNDLERDRESLLAYKEFREEAERKRFRHFLEVFHPNVPGAVSPELLPSFVNDAIARSLAGVAQAGRPLFLKIPYPGPRALEELVAYDPHLVAGILGGSSGTTRDTFQLIHDAQKHGARIALFGRKINMAENQLALIEFLRLVVDGVVTPEEAVRGYHAVLDRLKIRPHRPLAEDQQITETAMSYAGRSTVSVPASTASPKATAPATTAPSLAQMTPAERLKYHQDRLKKTFG